MSPRVRKPKKPKLSGLALWKTDRRYGEFENLRKKHWTTYTGLVRRGGFEDVEDATYGPYYEEWHRGKQEDFCEFVRVFGVTAGKPAIQYPIIKKS